MDLRHRYLLKLSLMIWLLLSGGQLRSISVDTVLFDEDWTGYICVTTISEVDIEIQGPEARTLKIGPNIVRRYSYDRSNPFCHSISFKAKATYLLSTNPDSIEYQLTESELAPVQREHWPKTWYLYFYFGVILMLFFIGIFALAFFYISRQKAFLFYACYIICYAIFFGTTYEAFLLFDNIESYTTTVTLLDIALTVTGIILYNLLILRLLKHHIFLRQTTY